MKLTEYCVKKGRHWSWPFIFRSTNNPKELVWRVYLDKQSTYDLLTNDQKDWNKLLGIKRYFFKPRRFSIMLAHRWNIDEKRHEFSPYVHLPDQDSPISYKNDDFWFALPEECEFLIEIRIFKSAIEFSVEVISHEINPFEVNSWSLQIHESTFGKWWEINTWFGGNRKAPSNYSIWKERVQ
jgi:hypothetical protein